MVQVIGIALLVIAQAFDFVSFLAMIVRHGNLSPEANPIVVAIAESTHLPGITIVKVATVVMVASIVVILSRRHQRLAVALMIFAIAAGVAGGVSNIASM